MTVTYVEPMTPLRDWLRTLDTLDAAIYVVGDKGLPAEAFAGDNEAADLAGPTIGITRVGGGVDPPFDRPLVQFECSTPRAGAATAAGRLAADLCTALEDPLMHGPVPLAGLWLISAEVVSNVPTPSTHPRHVVTADVTTQAR